MKKYKGFLLVGAVLLSATTFVGCGSYGGSNGRIEHGKIEVLKEGKFQREEYTFDNLTELKIEGSMADIEIKEGNGDKIKVSLISNIKDVFNEVKVSSNKIKIEEKSFTKLNISEVDIKILIEVPKGKELKVVDVENSYGEIYLEGVKIEDLDLEASTGRVDVENSNIENADIEIAAGQMELKENNINKFRGEVTTGEILCKNINSRDLKLKVTVGSATLNNNKNYKVEEFDVEVTLGNRDIEI